MGFHSRSFCLFVLVLFLHCIATEETKHVHTENNEVSKELLKTQTDDNSIHLDFSITSISAIDVELMIYVSKPSTVWCDVFPQDGTNAPTKQIDVEMIDKYKNRVFVEKSEKLQLNDLVPDSDYIVYCHGSSSKGIIDTHSSKTPQFIHTSTVHLSIDHLRIKGNTITYTISTNISLPVNCVLFDEHSKELLTIKVPPVPNYPIQFHNIDRKQKYFTQCAIIHNNKELGKTFIKSIDFSKRRFSVFELITFFILLLLVPFILYQLLLRCWERRKKATLFDEEVERVGLLRRKI